MSRRDLKSLSIEELEAELARRRAEASPLVDLSSLEDEIDAEAERLKQSSLEARVAALPPETSEPKPCPKCGRATRVRVKNRERTVETRSGTLSVRRHYHYCNHCKGGFFPRDRELGLPPGGAVSFGLEARIVDFGINETFARAAERWSVHYSKPISPNMVRRVVDRVGARCEASDERYLHHCLQPPPEKPSSQLMECIEFASADEARALNDLVRYYRNNATRMRYNEYRTQGYPVGSGIVESAHGHVIQQRMKRTGQRWSLSRARTMVRLRTAYRTAGCKQFHRGIRIAAEATRVAPIVKRPRRRASNR